MSQAEVRICDNCGFHNPVNNLECVSCGYDLSFVIPTLTHEIIKNENIKTWHIISAADKNINAEIRSELIIGREADSMKEFLNTSDFISRLHAKLSIEDNNLYITDASTNGTFVNGIRIEKMKKTILKSGDEIKFADLVFYAEEKYAD